MRARLTASALLAGAVAAAGCSMPAAASRAEPIVAGAPEPALPAVVAVLGEHGPVCSGTLVAPDAVLTAAHCVRDEALAVAFGPDASVPDRQVAIAGGLRDGGHDVSDPTDPRRDVGLLFLAEPVDDIAPMPLLGRSLGPGDVGAETRWAGYGVTTAGGSDAGVRRAVDLELVQLSPHWLRGAPAEEGSVCAGDSGGPALLDDGGGWAVAGVVHGIDDACSAGGVAMRIDASALLDRPGGGGCAAAGGTEGSAGWLLLLLWVGRGAAAHLPTIGSGTGSMLASRSRSLSR